VADETFDLVVANLLRTELMPLIDGIAMRVRSGGHAVFAGLLRDECDPVVRAAAAAGLSHSGQREMADANGDVWSALLMTR
jgi:ribosomal protein L11 methylase PrmA